MPFDCRWRRRWRQRAVHLVCLWTIGVFGFCTMMIPLSDIQPPPAIEHRQHFLPVDIRAVPPDADTGTATRKPSGAEARVKVEPHELPLVQVTRWRNCEKIFKQNEPEIIAAVHSNYTGPPPPLLSLSLSLSNLFLFLILNYNRQKNGRICYSLCQRIIMYSTFSSLLSEELCG